MNYFKKGGSPPLLGKTPTKSRFYKQQFLFRKVVEDYADLLRSAFFIANFGRDDRFDLLKHCGCTSLARCRQSRLVSFLFHYFTQELAQLLNVERDCSDLTKQFHFQDPQQWRLGIQ